jgi:hypothetical protein
MITYCKLRTGDWGLKGEGLEMGVRVKVQLKSGVVKEEKVGKVIFSKGEFAIATIDKNRPDDNTPTEETKNCWECGCAFTQDDCYRRSGDWNEGYCGC